ncbi:MAG: DUF3575 domain-containing protein [Bacteroidia bacterium]|nr:DUF3575 domain-containing protein [Bacteroidia bacterium]
MMKQLTFFILVVLLSSVIKIEAQIVPHPVTLRSGMSIYIPANFLASVGGEYGFKDKWSIASDIGYWRVYHPICYSRPLPFLEKKNKTAVNFFMVHPEARYYFKESSKGIYVSAGVYYQYMFYNKPQIIAEGFIPDCLEKCTKPTHTFSFSGGLGGSFFPYQDKQFSRNYELTQALRPWGLGFNLRGGMIPYKRGVFPTANLTVSLLYKVIEE